MNAGLVGAILAVFLGFHSGYSQTMHEADAVAAQQQGAVVPNDEGVPVVQVLSEEDYARILSGAFIDPAVREGTGLLIVEYSDFACPFCQRQHDSRTIAELRASLDIPTRYIEKHFSLFQRGEATQQAAELALCSGELGGDRAYYSATDALFRTFVTLELGHASSAEDFPLQKILPQFAKNAHTDTTKLISCMSDPSTIDRLDAGLSEMKIFGEGTPTVAIIDETTRRYVVVNGAYPLSYFREKVAELRDYIAKNP